jgi:membrane dipeptidase
MLLQDFYLSALSLASHWLSVPSLAGSGSPSTTSTLNTARSILSSHPLLDLHIDLPVVARFAYGNNISSFPYDSGLPAHVDLPRLRKGKSGGFFSIAFVPCPSEIEGSGEEGEDFNGPTNTVRDTLEQIDVTHNLEEWFHEQGVALARSTDDVYSNFKHGKISHIIGVEGAHMLGNSLAVMRQ